MVEPGQEMIDEFKKIMEHTLMTKHIITKS